MQNSGIKSMAFNEKINTNLILDPGHSWVKVADENFVPILFPSVLAQWNESTPGLFDSQTMKITIKESTLPEIAGKCRLVGEKAKMSQLSQKIYAHKFPKSHRSIAPWFAIAALSQKIPAGLKEVTIKDSWVVFLLFNEYEAEEYISAIAGKTTAIVEREINGKRDIVKLNIDWHQEKMHCLQEGTQAVEFARHHNLLAFNKSQLFGSINAGCNTVEVILQQSDGFVLKKSSFDLGSATLAKAIQPELTSEVAKRSKSGTVLIDQILDALKEGQSNARYCYGTGTGTEFTEIFLRAREIWVMNIMGSVLEEWAENIAFVDKIFVHGGSASLLDIEEDQFFFFNEHNPQFVDVWGALLWAQKNLFDPYN